MRLSLLVTSLTLMACSPAAEEVPPDWFATSASAPLPQALSGFGLYQGAGLTTLHPERTVRYTPLWPLWSNGSQKTRDLFVPQGSSIERRSDALLLPPGSVLFKTFSYQGAPVETRVMRLQADRTWEYGRYQWSGQDAARLEMRRVVRVPVEVSGERFDHELPNKLQCRSCHESSPQGLLLGVTARQLGSEGLAALQARGWLGPGDAPPGIQGPDDDDVWVKSYMQGNCVYCHNGWDGPSSSFDLDDDVFLQNTLGRPTEGNASVAGTRIVPGCPDDSVLFQAFARSSPDPELKPMPPEGVQRIDSQAVSRLRSWIERLSPQDQKECSTWSE